MRIVHVLTHSIELYKLTPTIFSQYDAYIHIYAKICRELGYESSVMYLSPSINRPLSHLHKYGHEIIAYPVTFNRLMPRRGRFGYEVSVPMIRDLIRCNADIIHVHSYYLFLYDVVAMMVKKFSDKKIVAHYHGGYPFMLLYPFRVLKKTTLPLADKIISVNRAEIRRLINYWKVPREKIAYIPNGVDTEFFKPISSVKKSDNVILFVGNLVKDKGVDVLLKAFAKCKSRVKDLRLIIVGEGPLRNSLEKTVKFLGLSESIRFLGRVTHEELVNIYNMASVTVLPSRYESFGLVLVESMACGTPVIATATEGARDIVTHGVDGFLVPINDIDSLANAICKLIENPELRKQMGKNARRKAEKKFSWGIIKELLKKVYISLGE